MTSNKALSKSIVKSYSGSLPMTSLVICFRPPQCLKKAQIWSISSSLIATQTWIRIVRAALLLAKCASFRKGCCRSHVLVVQMSIVTKSISRIVTQPCMTNQLKTPMTSKQLYKIGANSGHHKAQTLGLHLVLSIMMVTLGTTIQPQVTSKTSTLTTWPEHSL